MIKSKMHIRTQQYKQCENSVGNDDNNPLKGVTETCKNTTLTWLKVYSTNTSSITEHYELNFHHT